jgi:hypothetical protein
MRLSIPGVPQKTDQVHFVLQLSKHSQASLTSILFDVLQDFVGASVTELRTECQIGRGMPDRLNLGWESEVGFLLSSHD